MLGRTHTPGEVVTHPNMDHLLNDVVTRIDSTKVETDDSVSVVNMKYDKDGNLVEASYDFITEGGIGRGKLGDGWGW